jgi:putative chitinase
MKVTIEQLRKIYPFAGLRIATFIDPLNAAMEEFEINTLIRVQMFLAQIGHESGELRYVRELATGEAYEGRKDLGNVQGGWGKLYKGRGLIQLTGRSNYVKMQDALGIPCVDHPELVETPVNACRSAAWFWKSHGCNELADKDDFMGVTKRINGGVNGLPSRVVYFSRTQEVIK